MAFKKIIKLVVILLGLLFASCTYIPDSNCPYSKSCYGNYDSQKDNYRASLNKNYLLKSPKVLSELRYKKLNSKEGLWRGRIKGYGEAELYLQIFEKNTLYSQKYIGKVFLEKNENILFSFKTTVPDIRTWTWEIIIL